MRLLLVVALAVAAKAQNVPHLAYVFPAGAQRGGAVELTLGGQFLQNVSDVFATSFGLQTKVISAARPMNPMQANELRDRMQALQKLPAGPATFQEMVDIRSKLLIFNSQRGISPVLAETLKVEIAVTADALPGKRELRVLSPQGLSNPLSFWIGNLPEFTENDAIQVVPPAQGQGVAQVRIVRPPTDMAITIPAVVNGRIKPEIGTPQQQGRQGQPFTPGGKDRYRFQARQGQELAIRASARELIPYLADAVPGWFQAVLTLYDAQGHEVAYNDDYRFHPDPMIRYRVPADGEYTVEIKDALYRGRDDFVYRITMEEATEVLPVKTAETPHVKLPAVVNGSIGRPGEQQVYRFEGRAGEAIVAEVSARRQDSPLDSFLKLTDARGKQLAFNDDFEDRGAGLVTHQADSRIMTTLPANGTYQLTVGDVQQKGGPEYGYRLRISEPEPDFDLMVTPSAINSWGGMTTPITVHALRKDGFAGEIRVNLRDAPRGYVLAGAVVPAGQDEVRITLTTPPPSAREPVTIHLEGRATIGGHEVVREARPADDMMQAFFYHHLVPAEELKVAIRRGMAFRTPAQVLMDGRLKITPGGTTRVGVRLALPPNSPVEKVQYELNDPPEGVVLKEVETRPDGAVMVLECNGSKAKVGVQGNLIVTISGERTPPPGRDGRPPASQRVPLGTLPAVPFEIR